MSTTYYPDYKPKNVEYFAQMERCFAQAATVEALRSFSLLFVFDMSYDREDIMVALGRVERAKGWKLV